jgi:nucleotide-binding universal stress UspA family protein
MSAILVPVDGSTHALKALRIACDLAEKYGGVIALFHVVVPGRQAGKILGLPVARSFAPAVVAELKKAAAKGAQPVAAATLRAVGAGILGEAEARVIRRGLEAEVLPLGAGNPAESILGAIKQAGASVIVMGCRGMSDTDAAGLGSVSQTVFQKADCTCISVK